MPTLKELTASL